MVCECVVEVVLMSLCNWWLRVVVGEGLGYGAGAAQSSDWVGAFESSGIGAGVAHLDDTGVVVVAIFCDDVRGGSLRAKFAQKSLP